MQMLAELKAGFSFKITKHITLINGKWASVPNETDTSMVLTLGICPGMTRLHHALNLRLLGPSGAAASSREV